MSLHYQLIFWAGLLEFCLMGLLLFLPRKITNPIKKLLLKLINKLYYPIIFFHIFILFLFYDSTMRVFYPKEQIIQPNNTNPYVQCAMFYAQRNLYLTGITLFLGPMLFKLISLDII